MKISHEYKRVEVNIAQAKAKYNAHSGLAYEAYEKMFFKHVIVDTSDSGELLDSIRYFTGSKQFDKKLLDINCYISISGIITFKNSTELANTVAAIPVDKLLVDTYSPYLAPTPYRGKSNEPSYIIHIINNII